MIRFYKLNWRYIWQLILNLSWKPAFAFSVVFSKFSEYLVMIKDSPGFSFRPWKFPCFVYLKSIIILWSLWNSCKNVFVFIYSCLEMICSLCSSILSTSISEQESFDEQLSSFELWESDSILSFCKVSYFMLFPKSTIYSISCCL